MTIPDEVTKPGKVYIGDGVYVNYDGLHVVLTTEMGDGIARNRIFLDPTVLTQLEQYVRLVRRWERGE